MRPIIGIIVAIVTAVLFASCSEESTLRRHTEAGEEFFKAEDYRSAEIEFRNALRIDSRNRHAARRLGELWLKRGSGLKAVRFLLRARELGYNDHELSVQLGEALFGLGMVGEARRELMSVIEQDPGRKRAILLLAETSLIREDLVETMELLGSGRVPDGEAKQVASAVIALRLGNLEDGGKLINEVLGLNPSSKEALLLQGGLRQAVGDQLAAEESFRLASEDAGAFDDTRIAYASFLHQLGKWEEAKTLLSSYLSEVGDDLKAWRVLAGICRDEGNTDELNSALAGIFVLDPLDLEGGLIQVEQWMSEGDHQMALARVEVLRREYPPRPGIELALAKAYLASGNQLLGLEALERAEELNPDFEDIALLRARFKLSLGDYGAVSDSLLAYRERHPDHLEAGMLLAEAYRAEGRVEEAMDLLLSQISRDSDSVELHLYLGILQRSQNLLKEARDSFELAEALEPESLAVNHQLASLDFLEGNQDAGRTRIERQLRSNPEVAELHYLSAAVAMEEERWDSAEAGLRRAIELNESFLPAYGLLTSLYVSRGSLNEAAESLARYLESHPKNPVALMELGAIQQTRGKLKQAKHCYETLLEREPNFAPALNNLAVILASEGAEDEAYRLAERARTYAPNDPAVADTLGWIVFNLGDSRRAYGLLIEAIDRLGDDPSVLYHAGLATSMVGRADEASELLRRALQLNREFVEDADTRRQLEVLELGSEPNVESVEKLEAMFRETPNDQHVGLILGVALEENGRVEKARKVYERVLERYPNLLPVRLRLATLYLGPLSDPEQALREAELARSLAPEDAEVLALVGRAALRLGREEWAYGLLSECIERLEHRADCHFDLGWAAYILGKEDVAKAQMERVLETEHDSELGRAAKRFLVLANADPNDAEALSQALIEGFEGGIDDPPAMLARARFLECRGNRGGAISAYRKLLEGAAGFNPAIKGLARLLMENQEGLDEAESLIAGSREQLRYDDEHAALVARLRFLREDYDEARRLFEEIASRRELNGIESYHFGAALLKTGGADQEASAHLRQALETGIDTENEQRARSMLEQIAKP
ncbi:tetratricopeptide repeat protein [Haloferula sp.]|uniref:tetratricopeptide repeat protein n=1 Tax=Haloferula sp. TaxID=2497595 RepID=UPI003C76AB88